MGTPAGPPPDDQPTGMMRTPVPSPDDQPTGTMRTPLPASADLPASAPPPVPAEQLASAMRTPPPPARPMHVPPPPLETPPRRISRAVVGGLGGLIGALVIAFLAFSLGRDSADRVAVTPVTGQSAQTSAANLPLPAVSAVGGIAPTQTRTAELAQLAELQTQVAARPAQPTAVAAVVGVASTPPPPLPGAAARPATDLGKATFVGRVGESDAFVSLVMNGAEVTGYLCDGANLARWFTGTRQGNTVALTSGDGSRLTAQLPTAPTDGVSAQAAGTFTAAGGEARRFETAATTTLDRAGLYRGTGAVDGGEALLGVIVLPSGAFRGAFLVQEKAYGVASPAFGQGSLTASYGGSLSITAYRLGTAEAPPPAATKVGALNPALVRARPRQARAARGTQKLRSA